jgi:LAO/AO transport system kinase
MTKAAGDPGVFIRSVASRGGESGFTALADELADVLDAFGRDLILLETVGVGQQEHKIRFSAQTTVVVFTPEGGDDVQSLKSGLMEIGDVFVVNKSDRPNADRFAGDLGATLDLRYRGAAWKPPVVATVAHREGGVDALMGAIADHRRYLEADGRIEQKRLEGLRNRFRRLADEKLGSYFWGNSYIKKRFDGIFGEIAAGALSPYEAAKKLIESLAIEEERGT